MTIYGEYLFLENFIVGIMLLLLTAKLSGCDTTLLRVAAGGLLCGFGGFSIFLKMNMAADALLRVTMLISAVLITFGRRNWLKLSGIFMMLSLTSGGLVMALLIWRQTPAITHQGIIYIDIITYSKLICFGILAFGFVYWFVRLAVVNKRELQLRGKVKIILDGRTFSFRGYIDSGNSLTEPESGKPVVLLDKKGRESFVKEEEYFERIAIIPFKTVGTEEGYLRAIRTDILVFNDRDYFGVYVAFFQGEFGDYEVLLSRDFIKGGLLEDA